MDENAAMLTFAVKAMDMPICVCFPQKFIAIALIAINRIPRNQSIFQHTVKVAVDGGSRQFGSSPAEMFTDICRRDMTCICGLHVIQHLQELSCLVSGTGNHAKQPLI